MEEVIQSQESFRLCTACRDTYPTQQVRALGRGHICENCLREAREAGRQDRSRAVTAQ